MDKTSNMTAWVVGAIIVILALVGIWWVASGGTSGNVGVPNTGTETSSSPTTTY